MVKSKLLNPDGRKLRPAMPTALSRGSLPSQTEPFSPNALGDVSTRARLLDAATACFLASGFAATSMDMVRQRAGVSNGSVYHHFATKQALADALYGQVLREFHGTLLVPLASNPPATRLRAQAVVRAFVRAYLHWVVSRPDQARLLAECKRDDRLFGDPEQLQQADRNGFEALAAFITKGAEAGHLQDFSAEVWTALVLGPCIQLTPGWLARGTKLGAVQIPPPLRKALQEAAWHAVAAPVSGGPLGSRLALASRMAAPAVDGIPDLQLSLFAVAPSKPPKFPKPSKSRKLQ